MATRAVIVDRSGLTAGPAYTNPKTGQSFIIPETDKFGVPKEYPGLPSQIEKGKIVPFGKGRRKTRTRKHKRRTTRRRV